jgi:hypothetical protein
MAGPSIFPGLRSEPGENREQDQAEECNSHAVGMQERIPRLTKEDES